VQVGRVPIGARPFGHYALEHQASRADQVGAFRVTPTLSTVREGCRTSPCAVPGLPFGGVGNSGMGKCHGWFGFEAFANARGVLYHSLMIDPGVRHSPYSEHQRERAIESKL
jgi:aldehyde dehydrogenase (NAD+)